MIRRGPATATMLCMRKASGAGRQWIFYLIVPFLTHLVLSVLARTSPFSGGPLENFHVRLGIAFVVTLIAAVIVSVRRSSAT